MFEMLLAIFCAYQNAQIAKRKAQNTVVWVIITIVSYFVFYTIGAGILVALKYNGPLEQTAMTKFLLDHPLMVITFMFFGLGGYLLVRYILERMPDKAEQ